MSKGTYSFTTPIYYVNAAPHLGTAYTTIAADTVARYQRMNGYDVAFVTGMDEHGQKVADTAAAKGMTPQDWCDSMEPAFRDAWDMLGITYTDFVGTLISSVTDIVNMISYVLVAFVAISLVVSSIMIGIITYISVLERKKEIGILRSICASKGDISRVFNAETIIVGFTAGVIGIGLTTLACIPANAIVYSLFDVANVASLPWQAALILIAISVFLTFLAGLIPSSAASRKDPVEALRSE